MDGLTMEVFGNQIILDNLDKLSVTIQDEVQQKMEDAATVGLQVAEDLAAVRTGFMKSRLYVDVRKGLMKIGDDAGYAVPVELGHHTISGSFVPPQPFLVPGWAAAGQYLMQNLGGLL